MPYFSGKNVDSTEAQARQVASNEADPDLDGWPCRKEKTGPYVLASAFEVARNSSHEEQVVSVSGDTLAIHIIHIP